jgi:hypothetical protein
MIFKPRYNNKVAMYKPQMKGTGIGSVLLDGGLGGQNSYTSMEDYKHTINGKGLESSNLGKKLIDLVIKPPSKKKPQNIKFNL